MLRALSFTAGIACLLVGCAATGAPPAGSALTRFEFENQAFAARVQVVLYADDSGAAFEAAQAAFDRARRIEALASVWSSDSALQELNRRAKRAGRFAVEPELTAALTRFRELSESTGGAFEPTVGALLSLQGYYSDGGLGASTPTEAQRALLEPRIGSQAYDVESGYVRTHLGGVRFDLGAVAKGWAADAMLSELSERGVRHALVSLGGSAVAALEAPPGESGWPFEVELGDALLELDLSEEAVAISAQLSQPVFLDGALVSHLIDPSRLRPIDHGTLRLVVRHPSAEVADALATAMLVAGAERAPELAAKFAGCSAWAAELIPNSNGARRRVTIAPR